MRSRNHVVTQTLSADGNVSLTADPTFLDKQIATPSAPIAITIPNGNWIGQTKGIFVKDGMQATTETFVLSGTFFDFTKLQFDGVGHSAILQWTGSSWRLVGGAAIAIL